QRRSAPSACAATKRLGRSRGETRARRPQSRASAGNEPRGGAWVRGHDAVAAGALGQVERLVRLAEEKLGAALPGWLQRGDARADGQRRPDESARLDLEPEALGGIERAREIGLRQDDGEFLATEARDAIDAAKALAQDLRESDEDLVAEEVAARVVDALEVVQVHEDQGHSELVALGATDLLGQPGEQPSLVVQPGEVVGVGELLEFTLRFEKLSHPTPPAQDRLDVRDPLAHVQGRIEHGVRTR